MSRGHGRVQEGCWLALTRLKRADLYDIAMAVFDCEIAEVTESRRVSVQRALGRLQDEGLVIALENRGCRGPQIWATASGVCAYLQKLIDEVPAMREIARMTGNDRVLRLLKVDYDRVIARVKAAGMDGAIEQLLIPGNEP